MRGARMLDCCLYGGGLALILVGIGLGIAWPYVYDDLLQTNLILSNNSHSYKLWVETPIPMYLNIYLFNMTNAREFKKSPGKVKPNFEEIGPFVFEEIHDRVNVTWNEDGTVSYNQTRRWTYVPESSVSLDTPITNLDVVALTVSYIARSISPTLREGLNIIMDLKANLLVTKPANEWLFDGMDVPLIDFVKPLAKIFHYSLPFDKFGFFYQRNMSATYDGRFTALTGSKKLTDLGNLVEWNGRNTTGFYPNTCGQVRGSSGEIFPPTAVDQEYFTLFISDVCSALKLKYARERTIHGLTGREFVGDEKMFGANMSIPEEACYCRGACHPPGVRDVSLCRQGAPVFVSFPHFYLADNSYINNIGGMLPNKSLHEFRISLDPLTGMPINVRAQIQVNALLKDYANLSLYKNVPSIFVPMLWFSQTAQITPYLASQANMLWTVHTIVLPIAYVIAAIGLLMIIVGVWLRCKTTTAGVEDEEPIVPETPDNASS